VKSVRKKLFIPAGVNTRELISKDKNLGHKQAKHADKYNYLLHYLICARSLDKRLTCESWIPVHTRTLEKYVTTRHHANILKFWLDNQVIEKEPVARGRKGYVVGAKSISYRFTERYRNAGIIDVGYVDEKFEKKVAQLTKEFAMGKMDLTVKANAFIQFNLQELRINLIGANQHLQKLLAEGKISLEKANVGTVRAQAIRDQEWFCVRDVTGHRIHNNWVTLNKQLKRFCYIETGEQLVNIDVRNSQPVILAILLKGHYRGKEIPQEVREYISLCESGQLYENLAKDSGIDVEDEEQRTSFKKTLFKTIFYGRNEDAEKYSEWQSFKFKFKNVASFITNFKAKDYKALSITLQRLESEIILEGVITKIAKDHSPESFFALTIHDSITTTSDNAAYVTTLMQKEFSKYGIHPTFETKSINQ
jgi:hypothetical protein